MKNRTCCAICFLLLCTFATVRAGNIHFLPEPQQVKLTNEKFSIKRVRLSGDILIPQLGLLVSELGGMIDGKSSSVIEIRLVEKLDGIALNENEAYRLVVRKNKISIEATTEQGAYWGLQTLRQLHCKGTALIHGGEIVDWPAFRVRGFMQDVGRGYISVEELKREIDILSRYKINVFHWHLTENQAWRLESKIFPVLNDSCNMTRMPGKFYTLEEVRDLVEFCKQRQVMLIPEIDMPGHSAAFVRAFRHDMQSEAGMKILKLLVDEICETFDVPYLHIEIGRAHV